MNEQMELPLEWKGEARVVCKLHRSEKPIESRVALDEFTAEADKCFDYDFDGISRFYPFEFPKELDGLDFQIIAIVGSSGSGKSTFSRHFGEERKLEWDPSKAIISAFASPEDAVERLGGVGLNSIPTWCKPRQVLSVGEGFRADLARRLANGAVIDEFTSTVDRTVAASCSRSVGEYIRRKGMKRVCFVSCHKDFIDCLCPDYVIDTDDEIVYDVRGLLRRRLELSVFEKQNKAEMWDIFRRHHYLSADLNAASRVFVAYLGDDPVALCAILPIPNGSLDNGYRIHRLVVLPDYQGLGIGGKLMDAIAQMYVNKGFKMHIRTSHVKLAKRLSNAKCGWKDIGGCSGKVSACGGVQMWQLDKKRVAWSFKYVGEGHSPLNGDLLPMPYTRNYKQLKLF